MKNQKTFDEIKFYLVYTSCILFFVILMVYLVIFSKRIIRIANVTLNTELEFFFVASVLLIFSLSIVIFQKRVSKYISFINSKTIPELIINTNNWLTKNKLIFFILVFAFEMSLFFLGAFILVTN